MKISIICGIVAIVAVIFAIGGFIIAINSIRENRHSDNGIRFNTIDCFVRLIVPVALAVGCVVAIVCAIRFKDFEVGEDKEASSKAESSDSSEDWLWKVRKKALVSAISGTFGRNPLYSEDWDIDISSYTDEMLRIKSMPVEELLEEYSMYFDNVGLRTTYDEMAEFRAYLVEKYCGFELR